MTTPKGMRTQRREIRRIAHVALLVLAFWALVGLVVADIEMTVFDLKVTCPTKTPETDNITGTINGNAPFMVTASINGGPKIPVRIDPVGNTATFTICAKNFCAGDRVDICISDGAGDEEMCRVTVSE